MPFAASVHRSDGQQPNSFSSSACTRGWLGRGVVHLLAISREVADRPGHCSDTRSYSRTFLSDSLLLLYTFFRSLYLTHTIYLLPTYLFLVLCWALTHSLYDGLLLLSSLALSGMTFPSCPRLETRLFSTRPRPSPNEHLPFPPSDDPGSPPRSHARPSSLDSPVVPSTVHR